MKNKDNLSLLYRTKIWILVAGIIIAILSGFIFYKKSLATETVVVSINYPGGSDGLNPNGTAFNINELISYKNIKQTMDELKIENTTADELLKRVSIDISSKKEGIILTTYEISFKKDKDDKFDMDTFLLTLCQTFHNNFIQEYSDKNNVLDFEFKEIEANDFQDEINESVLKIELLSRYLTNRIKENGTYQSPTTNQSFQDLQSELNDITTIDMANIKSYAIEKGITIDYGNTLNTLQYKNFVLDKDYKKNMIGYETRKEIIRKYDEAMSAIVMIPSKDKNDEFYMSKTKIGIDYLVNDSDYYLDMSNKIEENIRSNKETMEKLNPETTEDQISKLKTMLDVMDEKLDKLTKKIKDTDNDYISYKTRNYMDYKMIDKTVFERINIKTAIGIGVLMTMFITAVILSIPTRRNTFENI